MGTAITSKPSGDIGSVREWEPMAKSTLRRFGLFWTRLNTVRQFSKAKRLTRIGIK